MQPSLFLWSIYFQQCSNILHIHIHTHRGTAIAYTMPACWQLCSQRIYHSAGWERRRQGGENTCEEEKLKRPLVKTIWHLDSFSLKSQRWEKVTLGWNWKSSNRNLVLMGNKTTCQNDIQGWSEHCVGESAMSKMPMYVWYCQKWCFLLSLAVLKLSAPDTCTN